MDFDELDEAEGEPGPDLAELRGRLRAKQVPESMPEARKHRAPAGRGFGGGQKKTQRVLYLHGPGSTAKLCERQIAAMFKNVPWVADFKIFDWDFWEGPIVNQVHEIHVDPAVQEVFRPFGPDFFSYVSQANLNRQDEWWEPLEELIDKFAEKLAADGPYDGLCGFDMGGGLAFTAARLAQEGDERFAGKFRYLMLFSTHGHKELSRHGQGKLRPEAPLQIPTFFGWSASDDGRPYAAYEDLCLYVHPTYRGVILHDQGHRPPNIQKGTPQCAELDSFVEAMQAGTSYVPQDSAYNRPYRDFWLPLLREPAPEVPAGGQRILVVVPDPMGAHGPEATEKNVLNFQEFPAQESPDNRFQRFAVCREVRGATAEDFEREVRALGGGMKVVNVAYTDRQRGAQWLPEAQGRDISVAYQQGAGRSRWVAPEDECALPWPDLRRLASQLLDALPVSRVDHLGLVGVGTGAMVAFALAEEMIRARQIQPLGLWTACMPTAWPTEGAPPMGALVTTPVRYLAAPCEVKAPPWRLETSTFGPFSHGAFESKEEMLKVVAKEFSGLGGG